MALTYDQISAITEKKFIPKLEDNIFDSNPMLQRLRKKQKMLSGGTKVIVPLNYATTTSSGWYQGADTLSVADNQNITSAEFEWKQLYANISINRREELQNSGDAGKLDLVKSKIQIAEKTMADSMGTAIYNATSSGDAFVGARVFVSTDSTYGGIDQSSYSWWQGQVDSSTTTLSISALQGLWNDASIGNDTPSVIMATRDNYDRYYALLQPQQRFMDKQTAEAGFTSLMFNGAPFIADSHVPSGYVFMFNEKYLCLYTHKDENFRFEPFTKPINQNVKLAKIYYMGALISSNNRMHGGLTNLSA